MTRKLCFLAVLFVALVRLGASTASAQAVDARKAIEAAAKAMGTTNLKSIQFTADGYMAKVGEQYNLTDGWPQYDVANYTRTIDFDAKYMRLDYDQKQGNNNSNGYPAVPQEHVTNILNVGPSDFGLSMFGRWVTIAVEGL
jgi:hypothetical protein